MKGSEQKRVRDRSFVQGTAHAARAAPWRVWLLPPGIDHPGPAGGVGQADGPHRVVRKDVVEAEQQAEFS